MKKNLLTKKIIIGITILFLVANIVSSSPEYIENSIQLNSEQHFKLGVRGTLYVGGGGPGNYSKIQDAIDDANPGDTVFVYDDSSPYYESILVDKSVTLKGENRDTTMIRQGGSYYIIRTTANNVCINGFTFSSIAHNFIESDYNTIENNIFRDSYEGFRLFGNFNIVQNNTITDCQTGIYIRDSLNNKILDNNIFNSKVNGGISLEYSQNNIISRNIICNNYDHGIDIIDAYDEYTNTTITNNLIENNTKHGISVQCSYNFIKGNTIKNNGKKGIGLFEDEYQFTDHNKITLNHIFNNEYGIHISSKKNHKCTENLIYHNNILLNTKNAYDEDENIWNNSYPIGGNYWDDYTGLDGDGDGIGDTPYYVPGDNNQDNYPLMDPINDTEQPTIELLKPIKNRLYIFNREVQSSPMTFIVFKIDVIVNASDYISGIDRVEFYIDNELKETLTSEPYIWRWKERVFFRHKLRTIAYDQFGNTAELERIVWKFF